MKITLLALLPTMLLPLATTETSHLREELHFPTTNDLAHCPFQKTPPPIHSIRKSIACREPLSAIPKFSNDPKVGDSIIWEIEFDGHIGDALCLDDTVTGKNHSILVTKAISLSFEKYQDVVDTLSHSDRAADLVPLLIKEKAHFRNEDDCRNYAQDLLRKQEKNHTVFTGYKYDFSFFSESTCTICRVNRQTRPVTLIQTGANSLSQSHWKMEILDDPNADDDEEIDPAHSSTEEIFSTKDTKKTWDDITVEIKPVENKNSKVNFANQQFVLYDEILFQGKGFNTAKTFNKRRPFWALDEGKSDLVSLDEAKCPDMDMSSTTQLQTTMPALDYKEFTLSDEKLIATKKLGSRFRASLTITIPIRYIFTDGGVVNDFSCTPFAIDKNLMHCHINQMSKPGITKFHVYHRTPVGNLNSLCEPYKTITVNTETELQFVIAANADNYVCTEFGVCKDLTKVPTPPLVSSVYNLVQNPHTSEELSVIEKDLNQPRTFRTRRGKKEKSPDEEKAIAAAMEVDKMEERKTSEETAVIALAVILALLFSGFVGAMAYYFHRKKQRERDVGFEYNDYETGRIQNLQHGQENNAFVTNKQNTQNHAVPTASHQTPEADSPAVGEIPSIDYTVDSPDYSSPAKSSTLKKTSSSSSKSSKKYQPVINIDAI